MCKLKVIVFLVTLLLTGAAIYKYALMGDYFGIIYAIIMLFGVILFAFFDEDDY